MYTNIPRFCPSPSEVSAHSEMPDSNSIAWTWELKEEFKGNPQPNLF